MLQKNISSQTVILIQLDWLSINERMILFYYQKFLEKCIVSNCKADNTSNYIFPSGQHNRKCVFSTSLENDHFSWKQGFVKGKSFNDNHVTVCSLILILCYQYLAFLKILISRKLSFFLMRKLGTCLVYSSNSGVTKSQHRFKGV